MVNSSHIDLNYKVKTVGPSGIATVELWYTHDTHDWKKLENGGLIGSTYSAEFPGDGLYGVTLVAHNGMGLSKGPPKSGDAPQAWIEVDQTKPVVQIVGTEPGFNGKPDQVLVAWKASDKHLAAKPVTILYAQHSNGPWLPVATVENSGSYVWHLPPDAPSRFLVRVEAVDQAGNKGQAETPNPLLIDQALPDLTIVNIQPSRK
jgi:hypothetical protein